jgi:hypothetical protein
MLNRMIIDMYQHYTNTKETDFHFDLSGGTAKTVLYLAGFEARYHVEKNNHTHAGKQCVDGMLSLL